MNLVSEQRQTDSGAPSSLIVTLKHANNLYLYVFVSVLTILDTWNSLPPSVRNASSLMSFRRNLKTVLFQLPVVL